MFKKFSIIGLFTFTGYAFSFTAVHADKPWFIGAAGGFGSTTWQGLVPIFERQNSAMSLSTPIDVKEGGGLWGVVGGVEAFQNFQLQFDYLQYPKATVFFDKDSLYSIDNDDSTEFTSRTHTWSIQGKFLVPWEDTKLRLFAGGGVAWMARRDDLLEQDIVTPTFALGLNYLINPRWMCEAVFSYTAGYGESELNPSAHYMPFLYGVFARLMYRLG